MILEALAILVLLASGSLVARTAGLSGVGIPAVGFVIGVALHAGLVGVLALASLPTAPWLGLALTPLGPGAWWLLRRRSGQDVSVSIPAALAVSATVIALIVMLRSANLINLTPDSFRYLTTAGLLAASELEEANPFLLESRLLSVPAMHSLAGMGGETYLRSATPLLAIACVLMLAWLLRSGLASQVDAPRADLFAVLAAALLVTNNRFVFHAFYLNGHLALATWLLLICGTSWLMLAGKVNPPDGLHTHRLVALQVIVIPAVVLTRPEAGLLTAIAILPLVLSRSVEKHLRFPPLAVLGASMLAWQGFLSIQYRAAQGRAPTSVDGLLLLGAVLVLASGVLWRTGTDWLTSRALGLIEIALWLVVVTMVIFDPRIFASSAYATMTNVLAEGGWGSSLLILATLVGAVLVLTASPGRVALRFPLTMFIPFSILLAYLRGSPYRIGPGDSLSRSLLHVVPLALLFVASSAASTCWGIGRRTETGSATRDELDTPTGR